eukprot:gene6396-7130_t
MAKRKHEEDEEESLLGNCEGDTSVENTGDTLGNTQDTLNRLEKGICTMTILLMNRAIEQMSTQQRLGQTSPRKRSRHDGTPDPGTKIVNKRWTEKLNPDKLSEKLKKHSRPGNLTALIAPKVNPEIWAVMSNVYKREDLRKANVQNNLSKVGSILAKCIDHLIRTHKEVDVTGGLKLD